MTWSESTMKTYLWYLIQIISNHGVSFALGAFLNGHWWLDILRKTSSPWYNQWLSWMYSKHTTQERSHFLIGKEEETCYAGNPPLERRPLCSWKADILWLEVAIDDVELVQIFNREEDFGEIETSAWPNANLEPRNTDFNGIYMSTCKEIYFQQVSQNINTNGREI